MTLTIRAASPDDIDLAVAIDDDAGTLFDSIGLHLDLDDDHPFVRAERARWLRAAHDGRTLFAVAGDGAAVGLLVLDFVDGMPYVEQLSVRRTAMRMGLGRLLLEHAIEWAAGRPLWLTTYAHVPWNRAFYESAGFVAMPASQCPPGILEILERERQVLPDPAQRIAMCNFRQART